MLFPTVDFAIFFVLVFTMSWLTMRRRLAWRLLMLSASYVFYGWWNWRFVPLLMASQLANQLFAVAISRAASRRRKEWLLAGAVVANLAVLAMFKYYGFFASSIVNALADLGLRVSVPLVQFVLPVGISFFTFQALSYVIDVFRGDSEPASLLDFALYLAFFPQIVAGPIVRAVELIPQFATPRDPRRLDTSRGFYLIVLGLFKKVVVADVLARSIVDPVFQAPGQHSALEAIGAMYGFSVQIFCDFSAYTDIAIGVSLLLGFTLPENFDAPYAARNAQDFWRRWHMTLSRWLRDYLYIPLGGNRGSRRATVSRNLMITMLLGGLWHGAAWTFVVWGGLHGAWLVLNRYRDGRRDAFAAGAGPSARGVAVEVRQPTSVLLRERVVTFHLVTVLWVVFRSDSLATAGTVLSRLWLGWSELGELITPAVIAAVVFGIGIQYVPRATVDRVQAAFSRMGPVPQGAILALALLVIDGLAPEGVAPFIYFQF